MKNGVSSIIGIELLNELFEELGSLATLYLETHQQEIIEWCEQNKIKVVAGERRLKLGNVLENYIVEDILKLTTYAYKEWRKSWPAEIKKMSREVKASVSEFKEILYGSEFFRSKIKIGYNIENAVERYNKQTSIEQVAIETQKSLKTLKENEKIQIYLKTLLENTKPEHRPLLEAISVSFITQVKLQLQTMKTNEELLKKLKKVEKEQENNIKLIKELVKYKNKVEAAETEKELKRQRRLKSRKQKKLQPFLKEYLSWILNYLKKSSRINNITKIRIRVALVCLIITGLRILEVRFLKVNQIQTLLKRGYVQVDLSKRGEMEHKTHLTNEGKKLLSDFKEDIKQLIVLLGESTTEIETREGIEPVMKDLFLFSATRTKGKKALTRQFFTEQINNLLKQTPELKERGIKLTSHSFRRGYITKLWKDTKDLEFVRQVIGHAQIQTTSHYVQELSDEEKQKRLEQI